MAAHRQWTAAKAGGASLPSSASTRRRGFFRARPSRGALPSGQARGPAPGGQSTATTCRPWARELGVPEPIPLFGLTQVLHHLQVRRGAGHGRGFGNRYVLIASASTASAEKRLLKGEHPRQRKF